MAGRAALLVVDVQHSVLEGCAGADGVVGRINALIGAARARRSPVVFVQHDDPDDPAMRAGSAGWHLVGALARRDGDPVVAKTYRDAFAATGLAALLADADVDRVVVTGAHSDFCVQTTALSALPAGFDVTLVADAHTARPDPALGLPAEAIIGLVNARMATMRHPGRSVTVVPAARVGF